MPASASAIPQTPAQLCPLLSPLPRARAQSSWRDSQTERFHRALIQFQVISGRPRGALIQFQEISGRPHGALIQFQEISERTHGALIQPLLRPRPKSATSAQRIPISSVFGTRSFRLYGFCFHTHTYGFCERLEIFCWSQSHGAWTEWRVLARGLHVVH